jgi:restriction system protein
MEHVVGTDAFQTRTERAGEFPARFLFLHDQGVTVADDISTERKFEYMRAALSLVREAGDDGIVPQDLFPQVFAILKPTGVEVQPFKAQPGIPRYQTIIRLMTSRAVKTGWMVKDCGRWYMTSAGAAALDRYPLPADLDRASVHAFSNWEPSSTDETDLASESGPADLTARPADEFSATLLEGARESAVFGILAHLRAMNEFEFQSMVGALLQALGYHVAWISPPGPDHGIDIIAYPDAIGALKPRIKVQVKHTDSAVTRPMLQGFFGVLGREEIGIYVSLGGFTKDAQIAARTHAEYRVTLIDSDALTTLWTLNYHKMTEEQKSFMRIEPVYFLSPK